MTDEPRYTLAEAEQLINERRCADRGHNYGINNGSVGQPFGLYCERCGKQWAAVTRGAGMFPGTVTPKSIPTAIPPIHGFTVTFLDKNGEWIGQAGPIHPTREAAEQWMKEATTAKRSANEP